MIGTSTAAGVISPNSDGSRSSWISPGEGAASVVDLVQTDRRGRPGAGTVHHVAFRARDDDEQRAWQHALRDLGLFTTEVKDRQYFHSIYFREPGGVLFELATDGPGFDVDEPRETMGQTLSLPPFLEPRRAQIETGLTPLD